MAASRAPLPSGEPQVCGFRVIYVSACHIMSLPRTPSAFPPGPSHTQPSVQATPVCGALPSLGRGLNLLSHCRQTSRPPDTRTFSALASWFGQDIGLYRRAAFQNPPSQHIPDDHFGGLCACSLTSPPGQTGRPRGGLASALPSLRFAPALLRHSHLGP